MEKIFIADINVLERVYEVNIFGIRNYIERGLQTHCDGVQYCAVTIE
jgi:hypothetical protein